jgi:hypothetical protein
MEYIIVKANESLENTPNLLAVLKEVGSLSSFATLASTFSPLSAFKKPS